MKFTLPFQAFVRAYWYFFRKAALHGYKIHCMSLITLYITELTCFPAISSDACLCLTITHQSSAAIWLQITEITKKNPFSEIHLIKRVLAIDEAQNLHTLSYISVNT